MTNQLYRAVQRLLEGSPDHGARGEVEVRRFVEPDGRYSYVINQYSGSGGLGLAVDLQSGCRKSRSGMLGVNLRGHAACVRGMRRRGGLVMSGAPSLDDELPSIGRASDGPIAGNGAADPFKQASNGHATPIELTVLTKTGGPLTKRLALAADGSLVRDGSACVMFRGNAVRAKVDGVTGLSALIETLTPSQAIALGGLRAELQDTVMVLTKRQLNGVTRPDIIARTSGNIVYHGPAFVLLDYDTKGMPANVTAELKRYGGFWPALLTVLPSFGGVARVTRSSTSAGLSRADTGAAIPGSDGVHVFVTIKDGSDAERFLRTLHERCWLAGLGWLMVGAAGQLLDRSIVDRMVGGPERLVFEGGPVLAPPLVQDKESRRPIAVEGATLDTLAVCPPLTIVERAQLNELKARERARLAPEDGQGARQFRGRGGQQTGRRAPACRCAPQEPSSPAGAKACCGRMSCCRSTTRHLAGCTVGDVLADPERFEGETLADPLEGVGYGRCCAKVMRRADGTPWIHSFAHGRTIYELKHDAASVRKAMEAAEKNEVAATLRHARRQRRSRCHRTGRAAPAGQDALRHRPARDQRHAQIGAAAAGTLERQGCARFPGLAPAGPAAADRAPLPTSRGCRRSRC